MKTEEQIKARIAELREKLRASAGEPVAVVYRLQGNIGALEWVLRTEGE